MHISITYDHRVWKIGLPVRSAVLKPHAGRLVVGWVTTSESLLLYVFFSVCALTLRPGVLSESTEDTKIPLFRSLRGALDCGRMRCPWQISGYNTRSGRVKWVRPRGWHAFARRWQRRKQQQQQHYHHHPDKHHHHHHHHHRHHHHHHHHHHHYPERARRLCAAQAPWCHERSFPSGLWR
ncbi:hypothetical protein BO72DRAFT_247513 [Aspergillus fijiensis CBS 313.89]|uniref:Uncharacterized protein n=1 Tax=Aspergillus fijiensis CBS 313.89 TaxID=1448319 RepID=A0A8G1RMM1_9EURO|nr:uncharacterized protein BO72DRAFT_247513 [Aspergillus fijiensis CBS 313.89]RAK73266.1 hypothetical protein BO72DRAFT_247513 [Aspergillus fijiensis CBS 313.89]